LAITLRSVGASPGANSANCIITKPAGLALGDFMLAHVVNKATSGTITPPADWTIIGAQSNTASSRSALFYKFAVQTDVDATTFTFTLGTTGRNRGEMAAWLGVDTSSPINVADQQINAAGTSIAVPTPTVTNGCTVLIIGSNALGGVATACSGSDPTATITLGYAVAYSSYCALACFSGVKSGTDAIDAHSTSTYTSAVSSGHAVALTPAALPIDLVPAEGNQTEGSDAPALTQEHQLVAAEGYQTELSDAPVLTQEHQLAAAEGYQTELSDTPALTQTFVLAADEGTQDQVSDSPAIEQVIPLVPAEGAQDQISDAPALSQIHSLIVAEGAQTQLSDAPALSQEHHVIPAEGVQTQASDTPSLAQVHVLAPAEGAQVQVSDAPAFSQEHHLAAAEGSQTQASDAPGLTQTHYLQAAEGYQGQASDSPSLSQTHILAAQEGAQTQLSDQATLGIEGGATDLIPAEGVQTQVSDEATIDRIIALMADEGYQTQLSDEAAFYLEFLLEVQKGYQTQFSDSPDYLIWETGQELAFSPDRGRTIKPVVLTHRNEAQAVVSHRPRKRWLKGTGIPV